MNLISLQINSHRPQPKLHLQAPLSLPETDYKVSKLRAFTIGEIGSVAWLEQHSVLEALNLQAHGDARALRDEVVKEAFVIHDKISLLSIDLVITEAWIQHALPLLRSHLASPTTDPLISHLLLQHHGLVANLLEILLHHSDVAECMTEEAALELCDWCTRQLAWLNSSGRKFSSQGPKTSKEMLEQSTEDELKEREAEIAFNCSVSAMTILRYLTDHVANNALSLSVLHRIAATNNVAAVVLPLLLKSPWKRPYTGNGGGMQRWIGGEWVLVPSAELHALDTIGIQAWLLLCNLVLDPSAVVKLDFENERFVADLLQVRSKLTPALTYQIPLLEGLLRFLEAVAMGGAQQWLSSSEYLGAAKTAKIVIEQTPKLRDALLKGTDWVELAQKQREQQFASRSSGGCSATNGLPEALLSQILENIDLMCDMQPENDDNNPINTPIKLLSVKVDAYCSTAAGQFIWHGASRFKINLDTDPEPITVQISEQEHAHNDALREATKPSSSIKSSECDSQVIVTGKRYRLEFMNSTGNEGLPPNGKLVVGCNDTVWEAMTSLPVPPTR
jgi:zinc finger MYND domain-containing protein 10